MHGRRGLALLLVVGALSVLGLLGAAFSTLSRLERRAAGQRVDAARASLLARSGVEDALARLTAGQVPDYGGEDWDGSGALDGPEPAAEILRPGVLDRATCPARLALRPSFFRRGASARPALRPHGGRLRGESGVLAGGGYALKVEDESAKIHVNGGFLDGLDRDLDGVPDHRDTDVRRLDAFSSGSTVGWNRSLGYMLNWLGSQLGIPASLSTRILGSRPPGGYRTMAEVQAAAGTSVDLSPFLTVGSWSDLRVVHPNAWSLEAICGAQADLKRGRPPLDLEPGGRPPVNLNAAERPVLVALLGSLQGREWVHDITFSTYVLDMPVPVRIADAILDFRAGRDPSGIFAAAGLEPGPFRTWAQFSAFVDALVPSALSGFSILQERSGGNLAAADLVKAALDPNTRLSKQGADRVLWRWIDKSDLLSHTTEGSLGPTGTFRVSCAARTADASGRVRAEASASARVEAFRPERRSTQADFCGGAAERVATYPCGPAALPAAAAVFDGAIGLRTVEAPPRDPRGGRLLFLHHFRDAWNAEDLGNGNDPLRRPAPPATTGMPGADGRLAPADRSVWPSAPGVLPGTLYPDGMHAQQFRSPAFLAEGNLPAPVPLAAGWGSRGAVSYWVKPVRRWPIASSVQYTADFSVIRLAMVGIDLASQSAGTGRMYRAGQWRTGLVVENQATLDEADLGHERVLAVDDAPGGTLVQPGLAWELVTACYDTSALDRALQGRVWVLGAQARPDLPEADYAQDMVVSDGEPLEGADLRFILGPNTSVGGGAFMNASDAVLDEFMSCDFGEDPARAQAFCELWAHARFEDGRYVKDGGRFLSAEVRPAGGAPVRVLSASWTAHLPSDRILDAHRTANAPPVSGTPRAVASSPCYGVDVDFLDAGASLDDVALQALSQGGRVDRALGSFRYRVRLSAELDDPLNEPLLESPWFDDITFLVQDAAGPRVLSWER